jgi:PAS domain S-box-containing protein
MKVKAKKDNKKNEELLHLASFLELNPNPVLELDTSGHIIYANPSAFKLFSDYKDIKFKSQYIKGIKEIVEEFTGSNADRTREIQIGNLWYQQMIHYVKEGKSIQIYGCDITERKRMEEALNDTRNQLQHLIDNAAVAMSKADKGGKVLYNNSKFIELFGYTVEDVPTVDDWRRLAYPDPEYREEVNALIANGREQRTRDGVMRPMEIKIRCKDGTTRWVLSTGIYVSNLIIVSHIDITDLKRVEEELRESRDQLQKLIDGSPIAVSLSDTKGNVLYNNKKFIKLFGYTVADMPTIHDFRRLAYPDLEYYKSVLAQMEKNKANQKIDEECSSSEVIIRCKDGSTRYVELLPLFLFDRILVNYIDLTERKRIEEELARRAEELARSNAELEQFAYVASHDLQEPLRMISSYTELLGHRYAGKLDKDADDFIFYAVDGAKRMKILINDLLLYSRVGTKIKPFVPVDCNEVFKLAVSNLKILVEDQHAIVTSDPLPTVNADDVRLTQLLQNLIMNAIKFHGPEPPRVHVSARQENNEWNFSVKDNGIGIDSKYFERIFVIFQRLHDKTEYSGTGIGLAVCKRIVQRHGGRIWVESELGKGADFHFTIPMMGKN